MKNKLRSYKYTRTFLTRTIFLTGALWLATASPAVFAEHSDDFESWEEGVLVYTTQQGETSLGVINPVNAHTKHNIHDVGLGNHNVFSSYDGRFLYVTAGKDLVKVKLDHHGDGHVVGRTSVITSGHLAHVGLTLDGKKLYASDAFDNVHVLDAKTLAHITDINIPGGLDPVLNIVDDALQLGLDPNSNSPHGLAIHPGGRYLYVPNIWSGSVTVIDTVNDTIVNTLSLGAGTTPAALGFSTDGRWCFVSLAVPGYMAIIDTSNPSSPVIHTTIAVGLSPIQVPANPTNRYFIAPTQTSSLLGNVASPVPDPVFNNAGYIDFIGQNTPLVLDLVQALLSALNSPIPGPTNDALPDAAFVIEIDDNYDNDGTPWEVIDTVIVGVGPHGVSYSPGGDFAFITNAQESPHGTVSVLAEIAPGEFGVVHSVDVGLFPNGITTRFGRNQNQ